MEETEITVGPEIPLPAPAELELPLHLVLESRRSDRRFARAALTLGEAAALAWAAYGTNKRIGRLHVRVAPSAGATYPLELYLVINAADAFEPGLYKYDGPAHALIQLCQEDLSKATANALLGQDFVANASAVLVWTAVVERCAARYRERAYRYIYLEAGHQAQNVLLAAAALGMAACPVGAFFDADLARLVGADNTEELPLYAVAVGR